MAIKNYTTDEKIEILENVIANSYSKNETSDSGYLDISKLVYEEYSNAIKGSLKLFFYSSGKEANNKPYKYHKQITWEMFGLIRSIQKELSLDDTENSLDSLLMDEVDKAYNEAEGY